MPPIRISFLHKRVFHYNDPVQRFQVPGLESSTITFRAQNRFNDGFYTVLLSQVAGTFLVFDHIESVVPILNEPP